MRNREEIQEWLLLGKEDDFAAEELEKLLSRCECIEREFVNELDEGIYSYGLECDFDYSPFVLEDEDDYDLKEVKRYSEGVVLYECIPKSEIEEY